MTKRRVILLLLIIAAWGLRVWDLPHTPPGLWYDEAYYSMDAAWLLDGGPWRLFFAGNNGREPIFIYLQTPFIWMFGAGPLTSRLPAPLLGTLTVPLVYVLARRLGRGANWSSWLPYLATAGFAISFWHVGLSRSGYRGILLPLAAALLFYTVWRGWREKSLKFLLLAGLTLGLSQYTYLAARALPLVFGLFALSWTALHWREKSRLKALWLAVLVMAVVSVVVFAPLGWIFYYQPELFSARTGDVLFTPSTPAELAGHLSQAIRLFIDAGDPNWRHHLPGRPMLGWLGWLGFWPGLIICLTRLRRPPHLFLVVGLLTLYLPALLSVPPVHALRLSALLPLYYVIFALGLTGLARWLAGRWLHRSDPLPRPLAAALIAVLLLEAGLTVYDYFGRWARAEETYVEYNGPLVDFVEAVIARSEETPVIIPFHLYVHPTTRYLLHDHFTEQPPPADLNGSAHLVTLPNNFRMLNVANIPEMPTLVWLARDAGGQGAAYVSRPPRQAEQEYLAGLEAEVTPEIYRDRFGRELAEWRTIEDLAPLVPMFTETTPRRSADLTWTGQAQLAGYEVTPEVAQPGQPITLNLYWRSLTDGTFNYRLFLQIIDAAGSPIGQWEGEAFREDMYRWRPDGILPSQHTLWLGPETPPGPYLIRLGFFDHRTGQRLPLKTNAPTTQPLDQTQLGLFYVSPDGSDPRQPATPLSATFAGAIDLIGVTLPGDDPLSPNSYPLLPVTLHWQSRQPTDRPYTVFLQLLNEQGEIISGWDRQPFNGLYPTDRWSRGEIIADTFWLPLPDEGLPPANYRLISGFYDVESGQRLPTGNGGDFVELAQFKVGNR